MGGPPTLPPRARLHDDKANLENERVNMRAGGWFTIAILAVLAASVLIGLLYLLA